MPATVMRPHIQISLVNLMGISPVDADLVDHVVCVSEEKKRGIYIYTELTVTASMGTSWIWVISCYV